MTSNPLALAGAPAQPRHKPALSKRCAILNPTAGNPPTMRRRDAKRAVTTERAYWTDEAGDRVSYQTNSVKLTAAYQADQERKSERMADAWLWANTELLAKRGSGIPYDRIDRPMTVDELANIPFAGGDLSRLLTKRS